jgi:hypothetical protein
MPKFERRYQCASLVCSCFIHLLPTEYSEPSCGQTAVWQLVQAVQYAPHAEWRGKCGPYFPAGGTTANAHDGPRQGLVKLLAT